MNTKNELDKLISKAWQAHYTGDNAAALEQFQRLIQEHPDHIDALWGLGLAYRTAGELDQAMQVFSRAQVLIDAQLEQSDEDYARFFMLKRMVNQQLTQMEKFLR